MNTLILNRETFEMPADGWYQVAPLGEFPHRPTGVVQVVDRDACEAMVNQFRAESGKANFAGLLIDFDHFSLDDKLKSEAAGWITEMENRDPASSPAGTTPGQGGLYAKIRWSDVGEECVKGGRYPDCEVWGTLEVHGQRKNNHIESWTEDVDRVFLTGLTHTGMKGTVDRQAKILKSYRADCARVPFLCTGFPCTDGSSSGKEPEERLG